MEILNNEKVFIFLEDHLFFLHILHTVVWAEDTNHYHTVQEVEA